MCHDRHSLPAGTRVAQDAADILLLDDNFASVVKASRALTLGFPPSCIRQYRDLGTESRPLESVPLKLQLVQINCGACDLQLLF